MTTIPRANNTPSGILRSMAVEWLCEQAQFDRDFAFLLDERPCTSCHALDEPRCDCPIPDEWVDDLARELEAALSDRCGEWMEALKAGRPLITGDLIPREEAAEAAAGDGHRWG